MNQTLQECEQFDQMYSMGVVEGDVICEECSVKNAASGAPVSSSFILQQSYIFRDKNEAGMQCDIIEEGEEDQEVEPHWVFEECESRIVVTNGSMAETMSGQSLTLFDAITRIPGNFEREGWRFTIPNDEFGEFSLSDTARRVTHQGKLSFAPTAVDEGHVELRGTVSTVMYLDAMRVDKLDKPVFAKLDAGYSTVIVTMEGETPIELHRTDQDRDPLQFVQQVFEHLDLKPT